MTILNDKWVYAWNTSNSTASTISYAIPRYMYDTHLDRPEIHVDEYVELCKEEKKMASKPMKSKKIMPGKSNHIITLVQKAFPDVTGEIRFSYGYSDRFDRFTNPLKHIQIAYQSVFDRHEITFTKTPDLEQCKGIVLIDLLEFCPDKNTRANEIYSSCALLPRGCTLLVGIHNTRRSLHGLLRNVEKKYIHKYKCNIGLLTLGDSYVFKNPIKLMFEVHGDTTDPYVAASLVEESDILDSMWMANINNISRVKDVYIPGMTMFAGSI